MARQIICDACGTTVPDNEANQAEWSVLQISKINNPNAPFIREELCKSCVGRVRRSLSASPSPV